MYTKTIAYKDFLGKPQNDTCHFNLETREIAKLLVELSEMFEWQESLVGGQKRQLSTAEVAQFFNNFETVMLASYGELSSDGKRFYKDKRFDFEASKAFSAYMEECLVDPGEVAKFLDGVMTKDMALLVKKSEGNLEKLKDDPNLDDATRLRIQELETQLAAARGDGS